MSDARLVSFTEDGMPIYRASGLYNCLSVLVASRLGLEPGAPPDWMEERFQQGHNFESLILSKARDRGMTRIDCEQMELDLVVGPAMIRGHIDALGHGEFVPTTVDGVATTEFLADTNDVTLIDAKAFAQSTWDSWTKGYFKKFPYYAWQMSIYQHILSMQLGYHPNIAMAIGLKDMEAAERGEVKLLDFRLDVFTKPLVPFGEIVKRILEVERVAANGVEGIPAKCDNPSFPCPYFAYPFHNGGEDDIEIDEAQIEGGVSQLALLADQRNTAYREMKALEKTVNELDLAMKSAVGERTGTVKKIGKMAEFVSSVTFYHSTYTSTDWDRIQAEYPGFDRAKYQEQKPSTKISVRVNPKRGKKIASATADQQG